MLNVHSCLVAMQLPHVLCYHGFMIENNRKYMQCRPFTDRTLIWRTRITQCFFLVYTKFHASLHSLQYEEVSQKIGLHMRWNVMVTTCKHSTSGSTFMYVPFCWFSLVGYVTTLAVSRPYSVRWLPDWWIGKDLEGCGHGLNKVLSCICLEELRNVSIG